MKIKKKTLMIVTAAVVLCGVLVAGGIVMFDRLFPKNGQNGADTDGSVKDKSVVSFTSLLLHESGMRLTSEYELTANGDVTEIAYYEFNYSTGEEKRVLQESVTVPTADVIAKLNECSFMKWDGFEGKHPWGVTDGTTFTLEAVVNGGRTVKAEGSQNFPKNYNDFTSWLNSSLG